LGSDVAYQGRLTESGAPVDGTAAMRFWLYDAAADGSLVAGPVDQLNVPVVEGLFTVELDFGPAAFGPDARCRAYRPGGSGAAFQRAVRACG
jgi:hypothetical protein